MLIEFEFIATPALGNKAMRYLLWRRGDRWDQSRSFYFRSSLRS